MMVFYGLVEVTVLVWCRSRWVMFTSSIMQDVRINTSFRHRLVDGGGDLGFDEIYV